MKKFAVLIVAVVSGLSNGSAQCCGGGSGSPIAGGSSQGVLNDRQMEVNSNFQYINTNRFYKGDSRDTAVYFDSYSSQYLYTRVAYGVTRNLTMSVETGYWFRKMQIGLDNSDTFASSGIGDLILFPRYDVINRTAENKRVELTVGLGVKIPLGAYNDSAARIEPFSGNVYYITKPISIQASSGSNDVIFYAFFYRGWPDKKFRVFANGMYIHKGWNPMGEKIGDYMSIGLFAGRTFFKSLGVTVQVRGEIIKSMQLNESVLLYNYPTYDPFATGSKKVFFVPQVSYTIKDNFTMYASSELPLYQYVTNNQVGSEHQLTFGISYRFLTYKVGHNKNNEVGGDYQCPMKCEGKTFAAPGKCPVCGMDLEKAK